MLLFLVAALAVPVIGCDQRICMQIVKVDLTDGKLPPFRVQMTSMQVLQVMLSVAPGYQWSLVSVDYPLTMSSTSYVRPSSLARGAPGTTLMNFMVSLQRSKPGGVVLQSLSPNTARIQLQYALSLQQKEVTSLKATPPGTR